MKRSRKTITQTEARRLQRRVAELEAAEERRRSAWVSDYPDGVNIGTIYFEDRDHTTTTAIRTARKLGHAVVAVDDGRAVRFHALPIPKR